MKGKQQIMEEQAEYNNQGAITIDGFLHERLAKTLSMNLNKIILLGKVV